MTDATSENAVVLPLAPIEPDWNAIRERYLQGEDLATVASECGTTENAISCRAYREGWKDEQLRLLVQDEKALGAEIRECLLISVLKECRLVAVERPRRDASERDTLSRARERLLATAARLNANATR